MKPHSHEKSKGIIIGVGSIGNYLDYDNLNTYISGNGVIFILLGNLLVRNKERIAFI